MILNQGLTDHAEFSVLNTAYLLRFSSEAWKSRVTSQNDSRVSGQFVTSRKIVWVFT